MSSTQRKLWRSLFSAHSRGGPSETIERGSQYLNSYPKDGAGWLVYGSALVDVALYKQAGAALRKAIKFIPRSRRDLAYLQMGTLFREKGSLRIAEQWYRKAVEANPKTTTGLIFLGAVLAKQGRHAEAKRCHRRAIKLGVDAVDEGYLNLGLLLRAERNYRGALKCFDSALALDPTYSAAKQARADVLRAINLGKR